MNQISNFNRPCVRPICNTQLSEIILSCGHFLCFNCVNEYSPNICPMCNSILIKNVSDIQINTNLELNMSQGNDLHKYIKLAYLYDIHKNDILWYYKGNGHNWLYTKKQSNQLVHGYEQYKINNDLYIVEFQIINISKTYIVDFNKMIQYPKDNVNKIRKISFFKLEKESDLSKNKIFGIAGQIL